MDKSICFWIFVLIIGLSVPAIVNAEIYCYVCDDCAEPFVKESNLYQNCEEESTTIVPITPTTTSPGDQTTIAPTTVAPTTVAPTTIAPTTIAPTTIAPTTVAPTTVAPTTAATSDPSIVTTDAPITTTPQQPPTVEVTATTIAPPTTAAETTQVQTTTIAPTTEAAPATAPPTTAPPPTTEPPITIAPTTAPPITIAPSIIVTDSNLLQRKKRNVKQSENNFVCYAVQLKDNDRTFWKRGCLRKEENTTMCQDLIDNNVAERCMVCDTDGCNSSSKLTISIILTIFLVIIAYGIH